EQQSAMSLTNKQPASLVDYNQLCKNKSSDGFSDNYHCMEAPKECNKGEFEWQRTEGKLNEIGLSVGSAGQAKDGLVKNASFTDEEKLCFFEGKLDKELKITQKDKEVVTDHSESQLLSEKRMDENAKKIKPPGLESNQSGFSKQMGTEAVSLGTEKSKAVPSREQMTDKPAAEARDLLDQKVPNMSVSHNNPVGYMKTEEISVWNPNFNPESQAELVPKGMATAREQPGSNYCAIGVINDNYMEGGYSRTLTVEKPDVPLTTIQLVQDDFKINLGNSKNEDESLRGEMEDKVSSGNEANLSRAAQQRKAMRRAMSECSHLSVPSSLDFSDKYPEPFVGEVTSSAPLPSPTGSPSPTPMFRKPMSQIKRSMTVAEEQTPVYSFSTEQVPGSLPTLLVKEYPSPTEENTGSSSNLKTAEETDNAVVTEIGISGFYYTKLEQIPEINSKERSHLMGCFTQVTSVSQTCPRGGENALGVTPMALRRKLQLTLRYSSSSSYMLEETPSAGSSTKPEEVPAEVLKGNDITAPPKKELPPSPEKKTKPLTTPSAKPTTAKGRPLSATTPKRPTSLSTPVKKTASPVTATVPGSTPKRPASSTVRQSTPTAKDSKPKVKSPVKSPEKRTPVSKPAATTPTPKTSGSAGVKNSTSVSAAPRAAAAAGPTQKTTGTTTPKRPTSIKTELKPMETKKTPVKSPSAEAGRPKTAPVGAAKSNSTSAISNQGTQSTSSSLANRPRTTKPPVPKASAASPDSKKLAFVKTAPKMSVAPKQGRPASAPVPDLKNVKSKIGSTDNMKYQPGGGRVQIVSKKVNYSHVQSKCGSKDNIKHVPGGGNVQILNKKIDVSRVASKCGSKANIKHKPGGGEIKIENQKLNFKDKAQAKVGSLDNVGHAPGGGNIKTEGREEAGDGSQAPQNGDLMVPEAGTETQHNGIGETEPAGINQRVTQAFDTQIPETN
uniref:Microtubule-associated protein n=1 Tax=Latimeria chalumnae TaxID=7897 RepID=H3AQG5_LATCH